MREEVCGVRDSSMRSFTCERVYVCAYQRGLPPSTCGAESIETVPCTGPVVGGDGGRVQHAAQRTSLPTYPLHHFPDRVRTTHTDHCTMPHDGGGGWSIHVHVGQSHLLHPHKATVGWGVQGQREDDCECAYECECERMCEAVANKTNLFHGEEEVHTGGALLRLQIQTAALRQFLPPDNVQWRLRLQLVTIVGSPV